VKPWEHAAALLFFIRISTGKVRKSSYFLKVSDSRFNFSLRIYFAIDGLHMLPGHSSVLFDAKRIVLKGK